MFRLLRMLPLLILIAVAGAGWWGWRRLHRSDAASLSAAVASVAKDHATASGLPRAGVYRYTANGTERIGVGPLTLKRAMPGDALLVVHPAGGTARLLEWRLSSDHVESWRTVTLAAGARGTERTLRVGTFGVSQSVSGAAQPSVMLYPHRLTVGTSFESIYRVSGIVFHRTSKVQQQATLSVGGVAVRVYVIATQEAITGALHGKDSVTEWYAPLLGLPVRVEWRRDIDGAVVNVLTESLTLQDVAPVR